MSDDKEFYDAVNNQIRACLKENDITAIDMILILFQGIEALTLGLKQVAKDPVEFADLVRKGNPRGMEVLNMVFGMQLEIRKRTEAQQKEVTK